MVLSVFCILFHHKVLIYSHSTNGETGETLFKTIRELHKFHIN